MHANGLRLIARAGAPTVLTCAATTVGGTTFAATAASQQGVGTCIAGYTQDPNGAPIRTCAIDGTWQSTITRPCLRTPRPGIRASGRADGPDRNEPS